MIAVVFWFFWVFCTVPNPTRATKFRLFWQFKPKFPDILLSSGLIGLVMLLSLNPVVLQGFSGKTLDFCGDLMVLFISLKIIHLIKNMSFEPLPQPASRGAVTSF